MKKKNSIILFFSKSNVSTNFLNQRKCEGSASYAVSLLMTNRRYKKETQHYIHLPFTIPESLEICVKYTIIDALNYAYQHGLI